MTRYPRLIAVALLLVLLAGWELAVQAFHFSPLVLPAPSAVAAALWRALATGYLWPHLAQTVLELALGLGLGVLLGFALGVLLGESAALRRVLMPYVVTSQVVPKLALVPLFIVWFGFGTTPTVVITALICFFPLLENTLTGIAQVDPAIVAKYLPAQAAPTKPAATPPAKKGGGMMMAPAPKQ